MKQRRFGIMFLVAVACSLLCGSSVEAHQPRLVEEDRTDIQNPEVSQAFYGEMEGSPHIYRIVSNKPFRLYVGILVPDVPDIGKDVSAEIVKEGEESGEGIFPYLLDGSSAKWERYHEEFGDDYYFWGPEFRSPGEQSYMPDGVEVDAGTYLITVFSPDNYGKYVLVVGEKEEFPFSEIVNTVKVMPTLKSDFFGKSPLSAFTNRIGLFLGIPVLIVIAVILLISRLLPAGRRKIKEADS